MSTVSLVTGGAGFIGSHVVDELIALGHQVLILDDLSGGFRRNIHPAAQWIEGSITDVALVDRLFDLHRIDYVYHLAAYAAEGLSHFIKRYNYTNNLLGSVNLINAAVNHAVKCFVFTSSIAVYGTAQLPMHEETLPQPEDPYGIAKYAVELDLAESQAMFGLPYVIFRPHNVYGERQNLSDTYRNVIGIFIRRAMQGLPLTIFGDGEQTRAFTHVDDVAPILARCVERPAAYNQVFNIGADERCSVNQIAQLVAAALDRPCQITHLPQRHEVLHAYASHARVQSCFGDLQRHISLEQGIRRMAAWAQTLQPGVSKPFAGIEVHKGLPPSWAALDASTLRQATP
ncbi:MAG: NAD-dependent epimerase/dehydratase family protein [Caldilinea sp.]|jgi:UDP-glucose 4-epimerase